MQLMYKDIVTIKAADDAEVMEIADHAAGCSGRVASMLALRNTSATTLHAPSLYTYNAMGNGVMALRYLHGYDNEPVCNLPFETTAPM